MWEVSATQRTSTGTDNAALRAACAIGSQGATCRTDCDSHT